MADFRKAAPEYRIIVAGTVLRQSVAKYILNLTYDHSLSLADMATIHIANPGNIWTDHKLWSPGNEVDIWMGWGPENVEYQGRVIIGKHLPHWGKDGTGFLEIHAYDASRKMMTEGSEGETFPGMSDSEIIRRIADKYSFGSDIESTDSVHNRFKKEGMSDFELVRGLANINNMEFYVNYDRDIGQWIIHWHSALSQPQNKVYTFEYGSSMLEISLEDTLMNAPVAIRVLSLNVLSGEFIQQEIEELVVGEDPRFNSSGFSDSNEPTNELTSHTKLKLAIGEDQSIEIITDRLFSNDAAALRFAKGWFQKRKDSFLIAEGTMIGVESLRPRQSHVLNGIGARYSGNYYFTTVRHQINANMGFNTEFVANKVLA